MGKATRRRGAAALSAGEGTCRVASGSRTGAGRLFPEATVSRHSRDTAREVQEHGKRQRGNLGPVRTLSVEAPFKRTAHGTSQASLRDKAADVVLRGRQHDGPRRSSLHPRDLCLLNLSLNGEQRTTPRRPSPSDSSGNRCSGGPGTSHVFLAPRGDVSGSGLCRPQASVTVRRHPGPATDVSPREPRGDLRREASGPTQPSVSA